MFQNRLFLRFCSTSSIQKVETRYRHIPRFQEIRNKIIEPVFSINSTNTNETLKLKQRQHIEKYQMHPLDVGSSQVQGIQ